MENMEKNKKKMPKGVKIAIIIVSIVLAIAILSAVLVGAVIGLVPLSVVTAFLIGEINKDIQYENREFISPADGAFEVTDIVELDFDGYGTVVIELYGKEAPKTVEAFIECVESGKILDGQMSFSNNIYDEKLTITLDGEENIIEGEYYCNDWANKVSHIAGVLTVAKHGENKSNANSFMILLDDHSGETDVTDGYDTTKYGYDGSFAAFGRVVSGDLSVIEKMQADYTETATHPTPSTNDMNELAFGGNAISVSEDDISRGTVEYKFIPKATGKYTFRSSKFKSILIDIASQENSTEEKATSLFGEEKDKEALRTGVEYELVKGVEYKIVLGVQDLKTGTQSIYISANILFEGLNDIEISEENVYNESVSYKFTAEFTGVYTIVGEESIKNAICIYDGENSVGTDVAYLEKGKTYTVILYTKDVEPDGYELTIAPPILTVGSNELEIPKYVMNDSKAAYYFMPQTDGKYLVVNKELSVCVYDSNGDKIEGDYVDLKKGEIYRLELTAELGADIGSGENTDRLSYTVKVQDTELNIGTNEKTIVKAEIEAEKTYFTFTATTNGPFSISAYYQKLDENGEQIKNESGGLLYVNAMLEVYDKDGNELDVEYAMLVKGETYTVGLKSKNIKPSAVCTIKIAKTTPQLCGARVL